MGENRPATPLSIHKSGHSPFGGGLHHAQRFLYGGLDLDGRIGIENPLQHLLRLLAYKTKCSEGCKSLLVDLAVGA